MIKITDNTIYDGVDISHISIGDIFIYGGNIYQRILGVNDDFLWTACLNNGVLIGFGKQEKCKVKPVDVELIIKDRGSK